MIAPRAFSSRKSRPLRPVSANGPTPGVSPALRPCVRLGSVPSAGCLEARSCEWRRGTREGSEVWGRGCGTPLKMRQDLFDHGGIFAARDHLHRTTTVVTGLDIHLEHPLQPLRLTLIATWGAGVSSSVVLARRRPRRAGVTCSRNRWLLNHGRRILRSDFGDLKINGYGIA